MPGTVASTAIRCVAKSTVILTGWAAFGCNWLTVGNRTKVDSSAFSGFNWACSPNKRNVLWAQIHRSKVSWYDWLSSNSSSLNEAICAGSSIVSTRDAINDYLPWAGVPSNDSTSCSLKLMAVWYSTLRRRLKNESHCLTSSFEAVGSSKRTRIKNKHISLSSGIAGHCDKISFPIRVLLIVARHIKLSKGSETISPSF